jgi:hypothetical protein
MGFSLQCGDNCQLVWLDEMLLMICRDEETVPRARMRSSMKAVQMLEYLKQLSTVRWVYTTKYVHIKSTTVYAPRWNWDSPQPPTRRLVCPLPPVVLGGGEHSLARKGLGESQFRRGAYTVVLFICTYFVVYTVQHFTVHKLNRNQTENDRYWQKITCTFSQNV